MLGMDEISGASPYGAGVFSGDGSKQASQASLLMPNTKANPWLP